MARQKSGNGNNGADGESNLIQLVQSENESVMTSKSVNKRQFFTKSLSQFRLVQKRSKFFFIEYSSCDHYFLSEFLRRE